MLVLNILWTIALLFTLFCQLPCCSDKIARQYGRWFGTAINTTLWYKMSWIGLVAAFILMFIDLMQ